MSAQEEQALRIIEILKSHGYETYFAGGWVRDRLLGIEPGDVDVATAASADEAARLFPDSDPVGRAFGVTLVKAAGTVTEVAAFRTEGPYLDGRRPSWVRPATAREDVLRRDFTINGMLYEPAEKRLLDWVGGQADLKDRLIRAIGKAEERFQEDYLRLFRAVRFGARLGFEIEPRTWEAIRNAAPSAANLAPERVRDELTLIFRGPDAGRGLRLLLAAGLLNHWLPEVEAMRGVTQPRDYHPEGDVFEHTARVLERLERPSATLAWGALLHDVGKPLTLTHGERISFPLHHQAGERLAQTIGERLRFSNAESAAIAALVHEHMRFIDFSNMRESTRKRFVTLPDFKEHLALHRADCLGSHGDLSIHEAVSRYLETVEEAQGLPKPLIDGHDLMALGFPAGPPFGEILSAVRDGQLDGALRNKNEALEWVRKNWGPGRP